MLHLTTHAKSRLTDRSVRASDLDCLLEWADGSRHRPGGADAISLTPRALADAQGSGVDADVLRRIRHLTVVIADGRIVTVYRRSSPHYRDGKPGCRASRRGIRLAGRQR